MRRFTAIFKSIFRLGASPDAYVLDTWAVVKAAALAQHAATKQPGLLNAVAFVDRLVTVVAGLKKPAPPADDEDDDEHEAKPAAETKAPPAEQVAVPDTGIIPGARS